MDANRVSALDAKQQRIPRRKSLIIGLDRRTFVSQTFWLFTRDPNYAEPVLFEF